MEIKKMNNMNELFVQHKALSEKIENLEEERKYNRSFEHKVKLVNLKKKKLIIKENLNKCSNIYSRFMILGCSSFKVSVPSGITCRV